MRAHNMHWFLIVDTRPAAGAFFKKSRHIPFGYGGELVTTRLVANTCTHMRSKFLPVNHPHNLTFDIISAV